MSIVLNDNIQNNSPKALDNKYLLNGTTVYTSVAAAKTAVVSAYRSRGLTVLVDVSGTATEYWWRDGVTDNDLILKDASGVPTSRTITTLPTISGGGDLSANRVFAVVDNTNVQKIQVIYNSGAVVGTRKTVNLIPGPNVSLSVVDNGINDRIDIEIGFDGAVGEVTVESEDVLVTEVTDTINVAGVIGALKVFPVYLYPTVVYTSTTDTSPAADACYVNTLTGDITFGTDLQVDQIVTVYWVAASS